MRNLSVHHTKIKRFMALACTGLLASAWVAASALAADEPAPAPPAPAAPPAATTTDTQPTAAPAEKPKDAEPCAEKGEKSAGKPCDSKDGKDCGDRGGKGCGDCDDDDDDCDGKGCGGKECDGKGGGKECDGKGGGKECDGKECAGKDCKDCAQHHVAGGPGERHHGDGHAGEGHAGPGGEHRGPPPEMMKHLMGAMFKEMPFHPTALIQMQYAGYTGANNSVDRGDRAERPGFAMSRALFGVRGEMGRRVDYAISADLTHAGNPNQPNVLSEAWLGLHALRTMDMRFGAQKVPFSRSAMLGSGDQALAARALSVEAMAPMRQVGFTMNGAYKLLGLKWHMGAFNSWERNANFFAGARENSGLNGNRFGGLSFVGRVSVEPMGEMGPMVGDHRGGGLRFSLGGGAVYNDSGTTSSTAMGADAHVKFKGLHLLLEWIRDSAGPKSDPTTPETIPAKLTRQTVIAELGYVWWRFNSAVRAELIDPNTTVKDNRDETVVSAAIGYQIKGSRLRTQLQFDHRAEAALPAVLNDTLFLQFQFKL